MSLMTIYTIAYFAVPLCLLLPFLAASLFRRVPDGSAAHIARRHQPGQPKVASASAPRQLERPAADASERWRVYAEALRQGDVEHDQLFR